MKKALLIVFCLMAFVAFAQTSAIVVTGTGATEEEAKNNAFVTAIEQAIGVMVSAELLIENGELIQDRIKTRSDGFIESYSVLSAGKDDKAHYMTVRAVVSQEALSQELSIITGTEVTVDGANLAANIATKQKLYNDRAEDFKDHRADELIDLLLSSLELNITETKFDYERAGEEIPFSLTVHISFNKERYTTAIAEIDKEFVAIGAKSNKYIHGTYNPDVQLNIEAYDKIETAENYGSMVFKSSKFDITEYTFSENSFDFVSSYFLDKLAKLWTGLNVSFMVSDQVAHEVLSAHDAIIFGYNSSESNPTIAPAVRGRISKRMGDYGLGVKNNEWDVVVTGTVPANVIDNMTLMRVDFSRSDLVPLMVNNF